MRAEVSSSGNERVLAAGESLDVLVDPVEPGDFARTVAVVTIVLTAVLE